MQHSLDRYRGTFKRIVMAHVRDVLGTAEWARLRGLAPLGKPFGKLPVDVDAQPDALFDAACSEDTLSVRETLIPVFKAAAAEIATIEGGAVYYVQGRGIYLWGLEPVIGNTLSVWLTFPAYPPGW